jgi:hypothetical protein
MSLSVCIRVGVLVSIAFVCMSQQVLAKNPIESAFRNVEKTLCKAIKSKNCARNKSKSRSVKNPVQQKAAPPVTPTLKPPMPPEKPVVVEAIPPEPVIDVAPEPVPPEPIIPPLTSKKIALPSKTAALPPIFLPPPVLPSDAVACQAALNKLNVNFLANPNYEQQGSCVIVNPVQLKSYTLNGQKLEFPDQPNLNCAFALQFINFIHDSAIPTVASQAKSQISKLYTGPGFVCRGRNGDSSAKMSEHAVGNAVDIERIQLADGRIILVKDAISSFNKDYLVLSTIRHSACTYFTTVLGPGANEAHASHFHFDLGQHGKSGTYRICE